MSRIQGGTSLWAQIWKAWEKRVVLYPPSSRVGDAIGKGIKCLCFMRPGQQPSKETAPDARTLNLPKPSQLFFYPIFRFYIFRATIGNFLSQLFLPYGPHTYEDHRDTLKNIWRCVDPQGFIKFIESITKFRVSFWSLFSQSIGLKYHPYHLEVWSFIFFNSYEGSQVFHIPKFTVFIRSWFCDCNSKPNKFLRYRLVRTGQCQRPDAANNKGDGFIQAIAIAISS